MLPTDRLARDIVRWFAKRVPADQGATIRAASAATTRELIANAMGSTAAGDAVVAADPRRLTACENRARAGRKLRV